MPPIHVLQRIVLVLMVVFAIILVANAIAR
jgi:hypothetical protein